MLAWVVPVEQGPIGAGESRRDRDVWYAERAWGVGAAVT
jgi:hypothetical protein